MEKKKKKKIRQAGKPDPQSWNRGHRGRYIAYDTQRHWGKGGKLYGIVSISYLMGFGSKQNYEFCLSKSSFFCIFSVWIGTDTSEIVIALWEMLICCHPDLFFLYSGWMILFRCLVENPICRAPGALGEAYVEAGFLDAQMFIAVLGDAYFSSRENVFQVGHFLFQSCLLHFGLKRACVWWWPLCVWGTV